MSDLKTTICQGFKIRVAWMSFLFLPFWIGSYLGGISFYFDIISNFKIQLFYGAIFIFLLNSILKIWKNLIWIGFAVLALGIEILSWSMPYTGDAYGTRPLKIYYSNVLSANQKHNLLLDQVEKNAPDFIALLEVNKRWVHSLHELKESFPYSKIIDREDNFGMAIFSRYELHNVEVLYFSKTRVPSIFCKIKPDDFSIEILVTHPLPPGSKEGFISRNGSLEQIGRFMGGISAPRILIGDLNVAMWSPYYQKMEESSGLYNARKGFGVCPSWPTSLPTQIPIDHCLLSKELRAEDFKILDSNGSDHFPIFVKVLY